MSPALKGQRKCLRCGTLHNRTRGAKYCTVICGRKANSERDHKKNPKRYKKYETTRSKELIFWGHIRRKYGLSPEDWQKMFDEQHGQCAICRKHQDEFKGKRRKRLCVDHDHKTGFIRGLLCSNCNHRIVPAVRDRLDLAENLLEYLRRSRLLQLRGMVKP